MEKKVALAQRLRSFLDECILESSTEVTTIESIEDAWQRYSESKNESWTIMHGMTGKMENMTMIKFDAFKRILTDFYKYEYVVSGPIKFLHGNARLSMLNRTVFTQSFD